MELFDGSLYWPTTYARATPVRPLHENIECEALIVGAGITGAMVAWELAHSGIDTVVVDRRTIAAGSTAASTAMLMYDLDAPLVDLRTRLGREHADGAYRASRRTIEDIARLVQQLDDPSDFVSRQSLMLASRAADVEELRHEAEARAELGIEAEFLDRHELARSFGMQQPGALLCGGSAEVNPFGSLTRCSAPPPRRGRRSSIEPSWSCRRASGNRTSRTRAMATASAAGSW